MKTNMITYPRFVKSNGTSNKWTILFMFQSRKASKSTIKVIMYNSVCFGGNRLVFKAAKNKCQIDQGSSL